MKIRFKKIAGDAKAPFKAHPTDAGWDLFAHSIDWDNENMNVVYGTGIAVEIPEGYVGLVFPRSSIAKKPLALTNSVGVIDSGYRGEVMAKFKATAHSDKADDPIYHIGERIVQLIVIPYPEIEWEEADSLDDSDRGDGGFGSSGR